MSASCSSRWGGLLLPRAVAGFVAADAFVKAEVQAFALQSVGVLDALTWAEQGTDGPLHQTAQGMRVVTLRTKVTVLDQRAGLVARVYLERLRDRMVWDSTRDALKALGLGFAQARDTVDLSKKVDQHVMSIGAIDLRFNLAVTDTDPTEYSRIASLGDISIVEPT